MAERNKKLDKMNKQKDVNRLNYKSFYICSSFFFLSCIGYDNIILAKVIILKRSWNTVISLKLG